MTASLNWHVSNSCRTIKNLDFTEPAMSFEVEAVYENGMLKLDQPLPLDENQRVKVVVSDPGGRARATYGIIGWQGNPDTVRRVALDPECGVAESP